ncbi:MAG: hypothetical protein GXY83_27005 [Rhodopirellula sp.]|nr:hypothetical protein [Rhodopirellula sp.]
MPLFAILEIEEGLTVAELAPSEPAETAARARGGVVVDRGPYSDYQEAYDAMLALNDEIEEDGKR